MKRSGTLNSFTSSPILKFSDSGMMKGPYVNSTKAPKLKSLNADISLLNPNTNFQSFIGRGINHHRPKNQIFNPYASSTDRCSDSPNLNSALLRYLYWNSCLGSKGQNGGGLLPPTSLASIEDLETSSRTLNVEEGVLVMDGILVDSDKSNNSKASGSARLRSSLTPSASIGRSGMSCTSSDGSLTSFYETEKRVPREGSVSRHFDSKCYVGDESEVLCSMYPLSKNTSEEKLCKAFILGSCTSGARCHFVHQLVKSPLPSSKDLPRTVAAITSITPEKASSTENNMTTPGLILNGWSPLDDSIPVTLPSTSSKKKTPSEEDINAYIHNVLYGPSVGKRLPVFTEICPE